MAMNQYSKDIHNQSSEIGRDLLVKLSENAEIFCPDVVEENEPEKVKALMEQTLDLSNDIMQYLATKNVTARYASMGIDKLIDSLTGLKKYVDGMLTSYEDEYLSRMYGIKNPEGKYRRESVTVADMILKLEEARQATGNNREDFFNDVAPKFLGIDEGSQPSPYVPETPDSPVA